MPTIHSQIAHSNGIPLGGIGTGSVEIRPDGYFHDWAVFNMGRWASNQPETRKTTEPDMGPGALAFYVRTKKGASAPLMRRLGLRTDQHNLYSFAWLKSVRQIEFTGSFPVASLRYDDDDLPVDVRAEFFSPFVPHDARTSGTPGFHAVFHVRNVSDEPVEVSLLGTLRNPVAVGASDRKVVNRVGKAGDGAVLTMRTTLKDKTIQTAGSMSLGVSGAQPSWIAGEFPAFFGGYLIAHWGGTDVPYGMVYESLFHDFRESGRLPSLAGATPPNALARLTDAELLAMPTARIVALIRALRAYPFVESLWRRVVSLEGRQLRTRDGMVTFLKQVRLRLDRLTGEDRTGQSWGDAAMAGTLVLEPQEEREVRFVVAWHFPNHYSPRGPLMGHMYEHWFDDSEAVARFLTDNAQAHRAAAGGFSKTLLETTLPTEMAQAWAGQLTTLPKCTWWTKDGRFGVWEGYGCCGFHTTDITYQGSFNILAMFPELQKGQMTMGAKFQRPDGRVHHFFWPDLSGVDSGFDRVDMNQQFVLLVCRDWLWTGDKAYLRRLWPNILRAMDCTAALDADGDGLPDHDTRRNTYDGWDFRGTPAYIASLWLSALVAAVRIADDLGHKRQASAWRKLLGRAAASFDRKLWNGEYYSLWVDGKDRDECCMTDQIDGEWFTSLVGLGSALPKERIVAALKAIFRHNFTAEDGLMNAAYPPGRKPRLITYKNVQGTAPWTGIEYAIASMMLDFGMVAEAQAVCANIHERYFRAGRFWNHVECGDHYYRAMSSWAILLGATGFKIDVPRQTLTIAPAAPGSEVLAPWVSATGWGRFRQAGAAFTLECLAGEIAFKTLQLRLEKTPTIVRVDGRKVAATIKAGPDLTVVTLRAQVRLSAGERVTLE